MAVKKDELFEIINNLPEEKLEKAKQMLESLKPNQTGDFEEGFEYLLGNYDDTLKGLQQR
jgi:soluble cytochrome b562